jgi:hypothetical protein
VLWVGNWVAVTAGISTLGKRSGGDSVITSQRSHSKPAGLISQSWLEGMQIRILNLKAMKRNAHLNYL